MAGAETGWGVVGAEETSREEGAGGRGDLVEGGELRRVPVDGGELKGDEREPNGLGGLTEDETTEDVPTWESGSAEVGKGEEECKGEECKGERPGGRNKVG